MQPLGTEMEASKLDAYSDSESKTDKGNDKGTQLIDAESSATISTTKI